MSTLTQIETATKLFADARQKLLAAVQAVQDDLEQVKRQHLPRIKELAETVSVAHEVLYADVKESPELFEKPKTRTFSGVRVGIKKEKGKLLIDDEETTIALIRKLLPEQADVLINTRESVSKTAAEQLPGNILKQLGVKIEADTDAVYIKPIGDDIDKFVDGLLAENEKLLREVA